MSSLTTLARPYARAAFEVAEQRKALDAWHHALQFAGSVAADDRVRHLIGDPRVGDRAIRSLFVPSEGSPEGFDNFIALLEHNDRLAVLPQIRQQFAELKDQAEQTLPVTVRSANDLDEEYRERLKRSLGKRFGKNIELHVEVDRSMVGGATIHAGDRVIDGSVRGKLSRLAATLTSG